MPGRDLRADGHGSETTAHPAPDSPPRQRRYLTPTVMAMTVHGGDLDGVREVDPALHGLLRRPFDDLIVPSALNGRELQAARAAYPLLSDDC